MARERYHLGGDSRPVLGDFCCIERSVGLVEQAHGSEDGDDRAVMQEIEIRHPIQWEGLRG